MHNNASQGDGVRESAMEHQTLTRIVIFAFIFALSACVKVPNGAPEKVESSLPLTVEQAVEEIISDMSEEDKEKVKDTPFSDLILYHHGWGTGIRNSFGLWRGNTELLKSACSSESCHPDDASMEIIYGVWNRLNGNPIRFKPDPEEP